MTDHPSKDPFKLSELQPLVYVAGPMSADPLGCVRTSLGAFKFVRAAGAVPYMPQWNIIVEMIEPLPYETWLDFDFDVLRHCHAIVRLGGISPGADREVKFCREELRIPVFMYEDVTFERDFMEWVDNWRMGGDDAAAPSR